MSEENGGIATTGKIRRTRRGDGRGRERGRETQVNVRTLITGTKRSTGIAEATTQTQSPLKAASYSSALDRQSLAPPHPPPVILPFFLLQNFPNLTHCSPPLDPSLQGCCCYLYDLNIMFMHKRDGAHSATSLGPLWTLKSLFFYPVASTPSLPPLRECLY